MKVYGFDLLPWPHLDAPSYYPDPNALFDPARGMAVYAEHLDQMAMFEELGFDADLHERASRQALRPHAVARISSRPP